MQRFLGYYSSTRYREFTILLRRYENKWKKKRVFLARFLALYVENCIVNMRRDYKLFIHMRYLNLAGLVIANEIQRSCFFISKPSSFRSLLSARFQRHRDARRPCNAYSNLTRNVWGASLICRNKRRLPRLEWAQDLGNKIRNCDLSRRLTSREQIV